MTGVRPKELDDLLEIPDEFAECWQWFLRLNNRRSSNGFGVNPISYAEIMAFFQLMEYQPKFWEIELIEIFDGVAMESYDKQIKKNNEAKGTARKRGQ